MARMTPQYTSWYTLDITYKPAVETLLDTPEPLPTSEPAEPQVSYTVQESDLPTLSMNVYSKVWVAWIIVAGYCPSAATVYYRMLKNGVSVASGSNSVSAGNYYTRVSYFYDVKVGDVLGVKLWSSVADSDWRYKAYQIQVTRIIPFEKIRLLMPCSFSGVIQPVLTLGNPSYISMYWFLYHVDTLNTTVLPNVNVACLFVGNTYGLYRLNRGDYNHSNSSVIGTSTTYYPSYVCNYVPTRIVFRGVRVD